MGDGNSSKGFDKEVSGLMVGARNMGAQSTVNSQYAAIIAARKGREGYVSPEERLRQAAQARADQSFSLSRGTVKPSEKWAPGLKAESKTAPMTAEQIEAIKAAAQSERVSTSTPKVKRERSVKSSEAALEAAANKILQADRTTQKQAEKPALDPMDLVRGQIRELTKEAKRLKDEAKRYAFGNPRHQILLGEATKVINKIADLMGQLHSGPKVSKDDGEYIHVIVTYRDGFVMTRQMAPAGIVPAVKAMILEESHPDHGCIRSAAYQDVKVTRDAILAELPMPSRDPVIPSRKRGAICTQPDYNRGARWQKNVSTTRVTFSGG